MFQSTEEQATARLNSERNLATRFGQKPESRPIPLPEVSPEVPIPPEVPTDPTATDPATAEKLADNVEIIPIKRAGNIKKKKLTKAERNEVAFRARSGETQHMLAREYGVTQPAVGQIEQGVTKVDENMIQKRLDVIADKAMDRLLSSLGFITDEKLEQTSPMQLSAIASNMGNVVGKLRGNDSNAPKVVVQIYAPELKNEKNYTSIEV